MAAGTTKAGRVDDPIWSEPFPEPVHRPRLPYVVRISVLIVVAMVIFGATVAWLAWPGHPGGDPGGLILAQLRPVSRAVPPAAKVEYAHYDEPAWDSCDGMSGTWGWDDPSVQVEFAWDGSPATVLAHAKTVLARDGWTGFTPQVQNGLPGGAWTKRLSNGTTAQVQVGSDGGGSWFVFGEAPPVGQRQNGC